MSKEPRTKTERDDAGSTDVSTVVMTGGPGDPAGPATVAEVSSIGTIGRFRLLGTLGSGGMADVYRAHDPTLARDVALKVLRTKKRADDSQRMRRVLREARAAAALTHPNTVTIFEVGESDGEVFIAMELLDGEVLRGFLGREGVSLQQKLQWLLDAARALEAAHERGLVHRDVKPDNMFVCKGGALKLLDFGIAKRDEDDSLDGAPDSTGPSSMRTAEGRRVGTPRYMAPEQHAGLPTDARTDEYAWGLVAFELLTGTHPVAASATVTTEDSGAAALPATRLDELRTKVPELPDAVAVAVARALELRKQDRFPSMKPIVEALDPRAPLVAPAALAVASLPPRPPMRWQVFAGAAAIGGIVVAGAIWGVSRARAPSSPAAASAIAALSLPPACRVESTRTIPLGPRDRFAVAPDGSLVVARNIDRGLVLQRETPAGPVPFTKNPMMLTAIGTDFTEVAMAGLTYHGAPGIVLEILQEGRGSLVSVVTDGMSNGSLRVKSPMSGFAVSSFGQGFVTVATTPQEAANPQRWPGGAEIYVMRGTGSAGRSTVEAGTALLPAVATTHDRIAFAYYVSYDLHLAMLDGDAQRIGDVLTIAPAARLAPVAIGFVDDTAAVFWIDDRGPKTRLTVATLAPNATAVSTPRSVLDEPVTRDPPLTARLPNGTWAVAWLALSGGVPTLRVSPIGAGAALTGPTDVAKLARFGLLQVTSGNDGLHFSWQESDATGAPVGKTARVTCGPKTP